MSTTRLSGGTEGPEKPIFEAPKTAFVTPGSRRDSACLLAAFPLHDAKGNLIGTMCGFYYTDRADALVVATSQTFVKPFNFPPQAGTTANNRRNTYQKLSPARDPMAPLESINQSSHDLRWIDVAIHLEISAFSTWLSARALSTRTFLMLRFFTGFLASPRTSQTLTTDPTLKSSSRTPSILVKMCSRAG